MSMRAIVVGMLALTSATGLPALYHAMLSIAALQQPTGNVVQTSREMFAVIPWFVWAYAVGMSVVGAYLLLAGFFGTIREGRHDPH